MAYDVKKEYKKWIKEKEDEESKLKQLSEDENIILELRVIDKKMLNSNRSFYRNEEVQSEEFFKNKSNNYNFRDMGKLESVLEELENELIYEILTNTDKVTYQIIELKYQGYEVNEISKILGISRYSILRKIKKLINFI